MQGNAVTKTFDAAQVVPDALNALPADAPTYVWVGLTIAVILGVVLLTKLIKGMLNRGA